jgi:pyruvate ferredoxin oxidoreductase gamma subunit
MKEILEIRWHGRGGQGAKTASQILAETAMDEGRYIQAFPEYGPERQGAPVQAFNRISSKPITIHSGIDEPDIIIVIDHSLFGTSDLTCGLNKGLLLANSKDSPEKLRKDLKIKDGQVGTVDATGIALDTLGIPMPNLPMLGALVKINETVPLDTLKKKVVEKFEQKLGKDKIKANIEGIERAYKEVRIT